MGNKKATKRITARRAATFLAAIGALVMSSGVALMVTSTPANAAPSDKIVVCKYVSTPGGHLDHIVIVSENTLPDGFNDLRMVRQPEIIVRAKVEHILAIHNETSALRRTNRTDVVIQALFFQAIDFLCEPIEF